MVFECCVLDYSAVETRLSRQQDIVKNKFCFLVYIVSSYYKYVVVDILLSIW